jgi:phage shock protein A
VEFFFRRKLMGLFKRVGDIISANLNEMVDRFEDPEKMLRQAIAEMEAAVANALVGAARVIANERLLAKQLDEDRRHVDRCQRRAEEAVLAGNDEVARDALIRKAEHVKLVAALADQHTAAQNAARKLRRQIAALRVRLSEARRKQATLIARKRATDARRKLIEDIDGVMFDESAFSKFDRMSLKVEQAEAETDALIELTGSDAIADEIDPIDIQIETELEALKQKLVTA